MSSLLLSTLFLALVTLFGGGIFVQWRSRRISRKEAVTAFIEETKQNAVMLHSNIAIINEERKLKDLLATPLVPLTMFALNKLPSPLPDDLLANVFPTDDQGKPVRKKSRRRNGAVIYLLQVRFSIIKFNAAVSRHESLVGRRTSHTTFEALLTGLDDVALTVMLALASVADFLTPEKERKQIRTWVDLSSKIINKHPERYPQK